MGQEVELCPFFLQLKQRPSLKQYSCSLGHLGNADGVDIHSIRVTSRGRRAWGVIRHGGGLGGFVDSR